MSKFVAVVGTQRSGTTVLRSILGSHPKLKAFGEVFLSRHHNMRECFFHYLEQDPDYEIEDLPRVFRGYLEYLERLSGDPEWILFDCKYQFLLDELVPGAFAPQRTRPLHTYFKAEDIKLIHIIRQNLLATYVSCLVSAKTQVWATDKPEEIEDRTVPVPIEGLVETLHGRMNRIIGVKRKLQGFDVLNVAYEELFEDGDASTQVLDVVAEHLGIENEFNPVSKYKKIGLPLSEAIRNYDEVCEVIEGTAYTPFLGRVSSPYDSEQEAMTPQNPSEESSDSDQDE